MNTFKNFAIGDLVKASGLIQTKKLPESIFSIEGGGSEEYHVITHAEVTSGVVEFAVNNEYGYRAYDLELVSVANQDSIDLVQAYNDSEEAEDDDDEEGDEDFDSHGQFIMSEERSDSEVE